MFDINTIKFGEGKSRDIFSKIAEDAAYHIRIDPKENKLKGANKTSQLRKFYDELAMWNDRVQMKHSKKEQEYQQLLPFIKMLKAKVAYALGRSKNNPLVDKDFSEIFNRCIDQIQSAETLRDAKFFMEAVMGYCKLEEAKNSTNSKKK